MQDQTNAIFDLILRGTLITPQARIEHGWLAISSGRIAALGEGAHPPSREMRDHGTALLLPGAIDGQVHACSWRGLPGLESTTRSAIAGGVTTIVDMPYDDPNPLNTVELLRIKAEAIARYAHGDVALYGTLASGQPATDMTGLAEAGICALKISSFENHPNRFPRIESSQMLEILDQAATLGLAVGLHNEDQDIVRAATARLKAAGETTIAAHSPSRPPSAELSATAHFLELAASAGAHAHIVHISVPRGFDLVEQYRDSGFDATTEMCLHYLLFDAAEDGPRMGGLMKVNPPIRSGVREELWECLLNGQAAFVSSDHSGWPLARKTAESIFDVSAGVPGLETLVPAFYTGLAERGADAAALSAYYLAEKPARFFGLWPQKGALAIGADADVMVLEPVDWIYDSSQAKDELNWSPYDGMRFAAKVTATYLRGSLACQDGQVLSRPGDGRFCRPARRNAEGDTHAA